MLLTAEEEAESICNDCIDPKALLRNLLPPACPRSGLRLGELFKNKRTRSLIGFTAEQEKPCLTNYQKFKKCSVLGTIIFFNTVNGVVKSLETAVLRGFPIT